MERTEVARRIEAGAGPVDAIGVAATEYRTVRHASLDDIDPHAFRSFLRARGVDRRTESRQELKEALRDAGAVREIDGRMRPTVYGLMAFGEEPQRHSRMMSCLIRCVAYAGVSRAADTILAGEGEGTIDRQVREALRWAKSLGRTETYRGLLREDRPLLPVRALRAVLANAVAHRDYAIYGSPTLFEVFDDRVCVSSPGALPDDMSVEAARAGLRPRPRPPVRREEMRAFNGTEPELENDDESRFVRVTFRLKPDSARDEA